MPTAYRAAHHTRHDKYDERDCGEAYEDIHLRPPLLN
jgi:hypothetical protein